MKHLPFIFGFLLLNTALALGAPDPIAERRGDVSASGLFVPVNIDAYASHTAGVKLPHRHVTVSNIPFDLADRGGADNLFLKSAQWSDWQKDPTSYYSAYDKGAEAAADPQRPMFKVPVADYATVYLLAAADNDRTLSNVVTFRIGAMDGARRTTLHDFSATVPHFDDKKAPGMTIIPSEAGNVFLVPVPLKLAFAQDFKDEWAFDVDVTKELRLAIHRPDPCRFTLRPLGVPSGVHIFGMTFARSQVQMEVSSDESAHVFNEPQTPTFHVHLHALTHAPPEKPTVEAVAKDLDGNVTTYTSPMRTDFSGWTGN